MQNSILVSRQLTRSAVAAPYTKSTISAERRYKYLKVISLSLHDKTLNEFEPHPFINRNIRLAHRSNQKALFPVPIGLLLASKHNATYHISDILHKSLCDPLALILGPYSKHM